MKQRICIAVGVMFVTYFLINSNDGGNWLASIGAMRTNMGHLVFKEQINREIIFEWDKMNIISNAYREMMKKLSDIIVSAYVPIEMAFLRKHPEIVNTIEFFKPFQWYFEGGAKNANWGLIEAKMVDELRKLATADQQPYFDESDVAIFVVFKESDGTPLGFVQFTICPDYPFGTVRLESMAIVPEKRHRGYGKLLISSIFKIIPNVDHIFLYTRSINEIAVKAYLSYGFQRSRNVENDPWVRQGYVKMEYAINRSAILQQASHHLK